MRFADMVGQEHVSRTLGNAIGQGRVHHAYLFAGARGLGKTTTARIFAKGLVCERGPIAEPCNACEQCVGINEGRSVDVVEIDGASNNSVDDIRSLREQVHYLPQSARRKIYIIDEVHMLTTSAFNALLKTLEEPPAHVNFVFATTEPQKMLATILSRVSRLDFRRVSPEELVAHLRGILEREKVSIDDGGLLLIARAAGGSVRDSLTLLDQVIAFADDPANIVESQVRGVLGQAGRSAITELVDAVLERDPDAVIERFDELVTSGHDLLVLSMQVLEHLRDLTLVKVCRRREVLPSSTDAEYEALRAQAGKVEATVLGQVFDRFTRIVDRLPTSRVQRLLLEMGLLDLAQAEPLMPLGDLVERLHALAGGGPGPARSGGEGSSRPRTGSAGGGSRGGRHAEPAAAPEAPRPAPEAPRAAPEAPRAAPETPRAVPEAPREPSGSRPAFGDSELSRNLWKMAKDSGVVGHAPAVHAPAVHAPADPPPKSEREVSNLPRPSDAPTAVTCSPCETPPARAGIIELDAMQPMAAWEALVKRIGLEHGLVSAVLSQVGLAALENGVLRVAAPVRSFEHTELSRPEIRATIEQAMRDHFGRPCRLDLVDGEPTLPELPSIVLLEQERREQQQAAVEAEAREHLGIRALVETFDARLASVKPI
jgi:DNA polymerase III subunit gamma/tau